MSIADDDIFFKEDTICPVTRNKTWFSAHRKCVFAFSCVLIKVKQNSSDYFKKEIVLSIGVNCRKSWFSGSGAKSVSFNINKAKTYFMNILSTARTLIIAASLASCANLETKVDTISSAKLSPLQVHFARNGNPLGEYKCTPSDGWFGQVYIFNSNYADSVVLTDEGSNKVFFKFKDLFSDYDITLFTKLDDVRLIDSKTLRPYECNILNPYPRYEI